MQRKVSDASIPPNQPYSSPTARRNSSLANTGRLGFHWILMGSTLSVNCGASTGESQAEMHSIADLTKRVADSDKTGARKSSQESLVFQERRENAEPLRNPRSPW